MPTSAPPARYNQGRFRSSSSHMSQLGDCETLVDTGSGPVSATDPRLCSDSDYYYLPRIYAFKVYGRLSILPPSVHQCISTQYLNTQYSIPQCSVLNTSVLSTQYSSAPSERGLLGRKKNPFILNRHQLLVLLQRWLLDLVIIISPSFCSLPASRGGIAPAAVTIIPHAEFYLPILLFGCKEC